MLRPDLQHIAEPAVLLRVVGLVRVVGGHALDLDAAQAQGLLRLDRGQVVRLDPGGEGLLFHRARAHVDRVGLRGLFKILGREVVVVRVGEEDEVGIVRRLGQAERVDIDDGFAADADAAVGVDGDLIEHAVLLIPAAVSGFCPSSTCGTWRYSGCCRRAAPDRPGW